MRAEPASFRDPDGRVFLTADGVFRALTRRGWEDWLALQSTALFREATGRGALVASRPVDRDDAPDLRRQACAGVLEHERLPVVSYPYEWTFGMLRDAALLQLDLLDSALAEELILKDASPYNVQWRGAAPVFADVGSFERLRPGEPWAGYRQFCMQFLYPLMLQAYRGIAFHPWLRGSLEGIAPADAARAMSLRDRLRPGVLAHVHLHARAERRYRVRRGREIRRELGDAGFRPELIQANVRRLRRMVSRLRWEPEPSAWSEYRSHTDHVDAAAKAAFVRVAAGRRRWRLAWDVGCNDGTYARLVAQEAAYVAALDADHASVEHLYRRLREEGVERILPLVMDVCDPSPDRGWRGRERASLERRGAPELTLCLALVHHLAMPGNVPVRDIVDWLASLGSVLVVEFPAREDPMVQRLLAAKREDGHPDYDRRRFEECLGEAFEVARVDTLPSGTRWLYEAIPR